MRAVLVLIAALAAACDHAAPTHDPRVLAAATHVLNKRLAAINDYSFEGTARLVGGAEVAVTFAFLQPQFARGTVGADQTAIFDGERIVVIDDESKTFAKVERSVGDENFLLALHNAFSEFACEGWRPPLLKPKGTVATVSGAQWILTTAIVDDEIKEEQLVLRASDGAFVEKRTLDKGGNVVATTRVLAELDDVETGLKLPSRWERTGRAGSFMMSITKARVNTGIARDTFKTTIPDGYRPGP
jgi:outer membrane lipoprotein-sorting protein